MTTPAAIMRALMIIPTLIMSIMKTVAMTIMTAIMGTIMRVIMDMITPLPKITNTTIITGNTIMRRNIITIMVRL